MTMISGAIPADRASVLPPNFAVVSLERHKANIERSLQSALARKNDAEKDAAEALMNIEHAQKAIADIDAAIAKLAT